MTELNINAENTKPIKATFMASEKNNGKNVKV